MLQELGIGGGLHPRYLIGLYSGGYVSMLGPTVTYYSLCSGRVTLSPVWGCVYVGDWCLQLS